MGKPSAKPRQQPRAKELRSPGAEVARTVAAMAVPKKVAVVLNDSGGSDAVAVPKGLRGGERVLSGRRNRFDGLPDFGDDLDDDDQADNAAADLAAAALANAALEGDLDNRDDDDAAQAALANAALEVANA